MPDVTRDMTKLVRELLDARIESTTDIREAMEKARLLHMDLAEVMSVLESEMYSALRHADSGRRTRARTVTRPLRHVQALDVVSARRCVRAYRLYLKTFAELIQPQRARGEHRRFDATK